MKQGIPLDDTNRFSWLLSLRSVLLKWHRNNQNGVLACSALKQIYRHVLNSNLVYLDNWNKPVDFDVTNLNITFILLDCEPSIIEKRLSTRLDHSFLNGSQILASQLEALERPTPAPPVDNQHYYFSTETSEHSFYKIFCLNVSKLNKRETVEKILRIMQENKIF